MIRAHDSFDEFRAGKSIGKIALIIALAIIPLIGFIVYTKFRIDVPARHFAVLTKKTGEDLENGEEIAPDERHKGLQLEVLPEGRYFYNPYTWKWEVYPMIEIPREKMGIRIRLYGEDLDYGDFLAKDDDDGDIVHKGIVEEVLKPGRYAINAIMIDRKTKKVVGQRRKKSDFVEIIELWEPKIIPAGYKGIVTNLAGPMPENPNELLVEPGCRPTARNARAGNLLPQPIYVPHQFYRYPLAAVQPFRRQGHDLPIERRLPHFAGRHHRIPCHPRGRRPNLRDLQRRE